MKTVLLFLIFVLVPIIVHLFNFKKAKKIYFSTIKYIDRISTETKSKTRLKYYLLLTSRSLLFLSLIWSLLLLIGNEDEIESTGSLIYLDNSISGSSQVNGVSFFDESKRIANQLYGESNESILLTNDISASSQVFKSFNIGSSEWRSLDYSYSQLDVSTIVDRIRDIDFEEFFFISDMQNMFSTDFSSIKNDSLNNYHFVVNDISQYRNVFIDTVFVENNENDFTSLILNVIISQSTSFRDGNVVVKLLSNGKQLSSIVTNIQELGSIQFDIPKLLETQYELSLSGDDIEYDNSYFLTISSSKKPKVSLLARKGNNYLQNVFKNAELFDFFEMDKTSIDFSILEKSDLIILDNWYSIPSGILGQFDASVVVFPSDSINYINSNDFGISLSRHADQNQYRTIIDDKNILFKGIFDKVDSKSILPQGSSVYSFDGIFESLIKLSNGETFLAKVADKGIYILSCPLEEGYTNLPVHGIFLPIMYQLAISSSQRINTKISYYPDELVSVATEFNELPIKMVTNGYEVVPEFQYVGNNVIIKIPSATPPGFYSLVQGTDTLHRVAINLSKSESVMVGASFDDLNNFFKNSEHVSVHKLEAGFTSNDLVKKTASSLWKIALILVLFFILTETMLHRYLK